MAFGLQSNTDGDSSATFKPFNSTVNVVYFSSPMEVSIYNLYVGAKTRSLGYKMKDMEPF